MALPVNFIFADGVVIFRTSDAMADTIAGVVAFEVDHIDEAMSEGWSVLVRGHARLIEEPEERLAVARLDLEPWAGGARLNLIGITPFELTGRVIVQHQTPGTVSSIPRSTERKESHHESTRVPRTRFQGVGRSPDPTDPSTTPTPSCGLTARPSAVRISTS